jgi:pimeloyl-ACP methyl ester carboxylesterase
MGFQRSRASAALIAALLLFIPAAGRAEESTVLEPRPGVTETVLYTIVTGAPASVILLPGGGGVLSGVKNNFLLRVRGEFAQQGLSVAVPDAPSDHGSGMGAPFRASAQHAMDLAAVIAFLRSKSPAPVWLVGTSRGTVSAANGGARLGPSQVAGIVLTSTVWVGGISGVPLGDVAVPVLVVHNRDDACQESPYAGAAPGFAQLVKAPAKELISVQGGRSQSRPCDAMSPHGYLGIEEQVVPPVIQWIKAHSKK